MTLATRRFTLPPLTGDWEKDGPGCYRAISQFFEFLETANALKINGAQIDSSPIGQNTSGANKGKFTTLEATGGVVNSGAALVSSGIIRVTGNTGLPAAGGSGVFFDYASSVSRAYVGDGTGYSLNFVKRAASVTTDLLTITDAGNVVPGAAALATNATNGFTYIQSCAGAPSGVPAAFAGRVPLVYDSTNNKLYAYNGAWKSVTLT